MTIATPARSRSGTATSTGWPGPSLRYSGAMNRWLVLTVGFVVAACQSSTTSHGSGGAGGGTGGQGGATTGNGGRGSGGASASGGTTAGGAGGGGGMNATEVCRAAVRAQAERIALCLGL